MRGLQTVISSNSEVLDAGEDNPELIADLGTSCSDSDGRRSSVSSGRRAANGSRVGGRCAREGPHREAVLQKHPAKKPAAAQDPPIR